MCIRDSIGHIVSRCSHVEYRGKILPIEKDGMQSVSSVVDDMLQEGMKAVSYTHLDVYKRQGEELIRTNNPQSGIIKGGLFMKIRLLSTVICAAMVSTMAVSYTHLDVYKRQVGSIPCHRLL